MILKFLFILLQISFNFSLSFGIDELRNLNNYCTFDQKESELKCENFQSFEQLSFTNIAQSINIKTFRLKPSQNIELNNDLTLELQSLANSFEQNYIIYLENLNWYDIESNPFAIINSKGSQLFINNFEIDFGSNQNCDLNIRITNYLFNMFSKVNFGDKITYKSTICPLIFRRAKLDLIEFKNLNTGSNELQFSDLIPSQNNRSTLNSNVDELIISDSNLNYFDDSLLNKDIFQTTSSITYTSFSSTTQLNIHFDLFKSLNKLKKFDLGLYNFESFFKNSSLDWLNSLNVNNMIDLNEQNLQNSKENQFKIVLRDFSETYEFSDEDFCLFVEFPHNKLVYPIIYSKPDLNCSCTLIWLLKYSKYYSNQTEINTQSVSNCTMNNFEQAIEDCKFSQRIKECKPEEETTMNSVSEKTSRTKKTTTPEFTLSFLNATEKVSKFDETSSTILFASLGGLAGLLFVGLFIFYMINKKNMPKQNKQQSIDPDNELVNRI